MFYRLSNSIRQKYSLTLRLLVLLLLVHTIASACSTDSSADEEADRMQQRRSSAQPDTLSAVRSLERATVSLLSNPFFASYQQSNTLSAYFDRINADFTLDADPIENLHSPTISDTIYTIRFGSSMMELYAPSQTGDLLLQTADILTPDITLRHNLRVGMSQAELVTRLKTHARDVKITQAPNEIVASNREGAPTTLHFYLQKGKVHRIKYDGYVD
ncbi:hypothetical protein [Pontibacter oryzae]|uniref:DUF4292 domain-containing protein n=1 Tax=Pontibacter oryzae TaxID=2304593 RepID=A0A399RZ15_9BACT|nr:hypothetical protein [Pontibacter oryzae]RIJ37016.1 hypothetical protein D1627_14485 [Pontibacter oryzae]